MPTTNSEVDTYFITIGQLAPLVGLTSLEFLKMNKALRELEDLDLIKIKDGDYSFVRWLENVDKSLEYSQFVETPLINAQNKTCELTETFINQIIKL
ncbi:hypothetical protein [Chryseobacterium sp. SC28]|uniref:hypothetical protein n=1 Tax=Chryseobacterium sp. SC28 TaxID=2268028 RepID=UPI000F64E39F|nr:hypothetical protein [Chryseobacterium sp. SC28]RRQ45811.1 hypothetical protein DTW91_08600 [Chryseobacterium sp. SC28]